MSQSQPERGKQIVLQYYDNEPTARLAEQRLQQEGIPCLIRSLHGGPGLWGSSYNLPHALYVYESDQFRARDVLELPPLEVEERDQQGYNGSGSRNATRLTWVVLLIFAIAIGWVVLQNTLTR